MKKVIVSILLLAPILVTAQIGLKGGLNYAKVSSPGALNASTRSGFHAGLFLAPASKGMISSRTELIFSRQGYDYQNPNRSGEVNLDYVQIGQLMSINITKFFSLMFGAQTAYLVSAQVDSSGTSNSNAANKVMDLMNRVDYGYAIGAEVHPFKGIVVGVRYNVSLAKLYKSMETYQMPSFTSDDLKNNVVMLSIGYRFGGNKSEKKEKNKDNDK